MDALQTQGFALSAFPRSPNIPSNVGVIDAKAVYDGVKQGLATSELLRQAPQSMALADAQNAAETAQAPLRTRQVLAQTQGAEQQTPLRTTLLAEEASPEVLGARRALLTTQAAGAQGNLAATAAQRQREAGWRAQAAQELPDVQAKLSAANQLADYDAQASDLSALQAQHPWIGQLPEYKGLAQAIESDRLHAQEQGAKLAERRIQEEGMQKRAEILGRSREAVAAIPRTGAAATLRVHADNIDTLGAAKAALAESPDDPQLQAAVDTAQAKLDASQGALNKLSASEAVNPNAAKTPTPSAFFYLTQARGAEQQRDAAKAALDEATASGDPATISEAQKAYSDAADKAAAYRKEYDQYHAERAKKRAPLGSLTLGPSGAPTAPQTGAVVAPPPPPPKVLTPEKATEYLQAAGNDKDKARELARKDGWTF